MRPAFLLFFISSFISQIAFGGADDKRLDIYWIDVEGGAATLLVTPAGESILIDTGMPGLRDPVRIHRLAKLNARLQKIDHLIITHFHRDHFGGAADLAKMIPIGNLYDQGVRPQDVAKLSSAYLTLPCDRRLVLTPGDQLVLKQVDGAPKFEAECLAALRRFIEPRAEHVENPLPADAESRDIDKSYNADSIVTLFRFGDFEFFDGGDLTWNMEQDLVVPRNLVGEVDVYQTNHHGLGTSNNPVLVHALKPRVAIMNNGDHKGAAVTTYDALRSSPGLDAIYQSHKTLRPDSIDLNVPEEFIANLLESQYCQADPIKLSVAPDSKSYTVSVPSRGHEATYETK